MSAEEPRRSDRNNEDDSFGRGGCGPVIDAVRHGDARRVRRGARWDRHRRFGCGGRVMGMSDIYSPENIARSRGRATWFRRAAEDADEATGREYLEAAEAIERGADEREAAGRG